MDAPISIPEEIDRLLQLRNLIGVEEGGEHLCETVHEIGVGGRLVGGKRLDDLGVDIHGERWGGLAELLGGDGRDDGVKDREERLEFVLCERWRGHCEGRLWNVNECGVN